MSDDSDSVEESFSSESLEGNLGTLTRESLRSLAKALNERLVFLQSLDAEQLQGYHDEIYGLKLYWNEEIRTRIEDVVSMVKSAADMTLGDRLVIQPAEESTEEEEDDDIDYDRDSLKGLYAFKQVALDEGDLPKDEDPLIPPSFVAGDNERFKAIAASPAFKLACKYSKEDNSTVQLVVAWDPFLQRVMSCVVKSSDWPKISASTVGALRSPGTGALLECALASIWANSCSFQDVFVFGVDIEEAAAISQLDLSAKGGWNE